MAEPYCVRMLIPVRERSVSSRFFVDREYRGTPVCFIVSFPEEIDPGSLQKALDETTRRFPFIRQFITAVNGGFYLAEGDYRPELELLPSGDEPVVDRPGQDFRVFVRGNTVVTAVNHAVMDGYGLFRVTKHLLECYASYSGTKTDSGSFLQEPDASDEFDPLETETAGEAGTIPFPFRKAFHLPFDRNRRNEMIECKTDAGAVLELCRRLHTSPSVLFVLLIAEAIRREYPESRKDHIVASLPINYRRSLGCENTLRNVSWSWFIDLDAEAMAEMNLEHRSVWLRTLLTDRLSSRYAKEWIRLEQDLNRIALSSFRIKAKGRELSAAAGYTFMLSYMRLKRSEIPGNSEWIFTGRSFPEDFTMMEYHDSFRVWFSPFQSLSFEETLMTVFAEHGLAGERQIRRKPDISFHVPVFLLNARSVFFLPGTQEGSLDRMLPAVRYAAGKGFAVRVYAKKENRPVIEGTGVVCVSCEGNPEDMLEQDLAVWQPECLISGGKKGIRMDVFSSLDREEFINRLETAEKSHPQMFPGEKHRRILYKDIRHLNAKAGEEFVRGFLRLMENDENEGTVWQAACLRLKNDLSVLFFSSLQEKEPEILKLCVAQFLKL